MLDYEYNNYEYFKWIEQVIRHAKHQYGAEIDMYAEEDAFVYEYKRNKIQVKGATPPRDKLYILLHELGHLARLSENSSDNTYFMDRSGAKSERQKMMTLIEEVLAWHKADEIARMLQVPIEKRAWQRLINKSIEQYADWACNKEI